MLWSWVGPGRQLWGWLPAPVLRLLSHSFAVSGTVPVAGCSQRSACDKSFKQALSLLPDTSF